MENQPPQSRSRWNGLRAVVVVAIVVVAAWAVYTLAARGKSDSLVVYCAHDSVYADAVLKSFETSTGIPVSIRYDTEATKSLGLVELLLSEKDAPRCDVFWNNEVLGTLRLQRNGVLTPYQGTGYARIPERYKDPEGCWTGFAARLRVYIVNTEKMKNDAEEILKRMEGDLSRTAIAKPLYGTTFTHYCALWSLWGPEKLQAWHRDVRSRGLHEATGNAHVKNLVAEGVCDFGWTDSDDFFVGVDEKKPVAMCPIRLDNGQVICIPNTVGIIRGTPRMKQAQQLVDYLLSAESETALASSASRQVPLGPVDDSKLPESVRGLRANVENGCPMSKLSEVSEACLTWLKSEYLR